MPGEGKVVPVGTGHRIQPKPRQNGVERLAMQHVERRPGPIAGAHRLHLWLILRAPGVGDRQPIHAAHAEFAPERLTLASDARPPIDAGAKDVEEKCFWLGFHVHR